MAQPGTHGGCRGNIRLDTPWVPTNGLPSGGFDEPGKAAKCPTPVGGTEDAAHGGAEITS